MDRYQLAREFEFTKLKDNINRISDADELKVVALELLQLNFGFREYINTLLKEEVPIAHLPERQ
tara:strand:+ start:1153 stop:1344 length:192 start_codon:yes stop_codon:yes gene_type:complete